jgi:hypothetical protein
VRIWFPIHRRIVPFLPVWAGTCPFAHCRPPDL